MKTKEQKLSDAELDISNLLTFMNQCIERLCIRVSEYNELQRQLYVQEGLEQANIYANFQE